MGFSSGMDEDVKIPMTGQHLQSFLLKRLQMLATRHKMNIHPHTRQETAKIASHTPDTDHPDLSDDLARQLADQPIRAEPTPRLPALDRSAVLASEEGVTR